MARLELEDVSKAFGPTVAVREVSLLIEDNEFFCIFGPPACGKTTLLRLWLGLRQPDTGRVLIDGRDMAGVAPGARNLTMVFQNLALFPHLTAAENLAFPLRERGVERHEIERRVMDAAERLHIVPLLQKRPGQLSGGERQRVAIGRTLVRDPAAFLMDEPIAALDARLREEMRVELKRLQRELRHTMVYVTHDQEEAMSVADRMAIMREGRIVQVGTPDDIYSRPIDRYVAGLVGSPPMNFVIGGVRGGAFASADRHIVIRLPVGVMDGAVEIGIRPEDIRLAARGEEIGIAGVVESVELLGTYTVLEVRAGEALLRVDVPGQAGLHPGSSAELFLDPAACHLFSTIDGRTL
jgi:multiple sugar transport system ATP-binding protein